MMKTHFKQLVYWGITCVCVLAAFPSLAETQNGKVVGERVWIVPPGESGYEFWLSYQIFPDTQAPGYPNWPVRTNSGQKVPYKVLLGSDFTQEAKEDLAAQFESAYASWGIDPANRVGLPTGRYNCFAYAVGELSYWVDDISPYYIRSGPSNSDFQKVELMEEAEIAVHYHAHAYDYEHASRIVRATIEIWGQSYNVYQCQGKYSWWGIYKSFPHVPEGIYEVDTTDYLKER